MQARIANDELMNILMVTNEFLPSIGGVQTHVHELSRALVRLGHAVHVLTRRRDQSAPADEFIDGIRVHRCRLADSHLIYDWQLRRRLKKLVREFAIDVVHVHGMRPLKACAGAAATVVFTNHTSGFLRRAGLGEKLREKMRRQLEIADCVLAPSEELADRTRETGYTGDVKFIANGVDTEKFCPGESDLRVSLSIPQSAFVAVLARRLVQKNGVLYLARALAQIESTDFHLVVAGDGAERGDFETLARASACGDRVHMLGAVANASMPNVYRAADVAILPSLMEATSIAGLEAMACGLPLIGTRVGGIPAIVDDGLSGILVEPANVDAMAAAINALLADRERASALGRSSLAKAQEQFCWPEIARQTLSVYQRGHRQRGRR